jgi:ribosomal protein S18 acetylase RimI-like enzyme
LDARIQQSVVANLSGRPSPIDVGPFVIGFDPATAQPGINYATPRPGAAITAADVAALVSAFRAVDRMPRLEYVTSSAPELEQHLLAAGFTVEARHTYLVCVPDTLTAPPAPEGIELREPATDEDRAAMVGSQHEAFAGVAVVDDADVARMRRLQALGGVSIMAVADDGACAGGGQAVPPNDGVSEVAGIAVRVPYRRRGIAGAVTGEVSRRLFAAGLEIAWLEASGEGSWRVYERVGFRPAGQRLYVALS